MSSYCADQLDLFASDKSSCAVLEAANKNAENQISPAVEIESSTPPSRRKRQKRKATKKRSNAKTDSASESNQSHASPTPAKQLYFSDRDVAKRYAISRPTVWRWVQAVEGFPAPIRLAPGTTRWALADLEAYERNLAELLSAGSCSQKGRES